MNGRALALVALLGWTGASAQEARLVVCHAGSISAGIKAAEEAFTRRTGVAVEDISGGSVSLARKAASGKVACDLYAGADYLVIDRMLKPAGFAEFGIRIAGGAMVLAYAGTSRGAATIAAPGPFDPPAQVPEAARDWYLQLIQPGVKIAGAHPFLDPGGYRTDMIFQLAQDYAGVPNLYDDLVTHLTIGNAPGGLGKTWDYQIIYEHSALAMARADATGAFRYVRLPDAVNLGSPALDGRYAARSVTMPGLQTPGATGPVTIPASRVTWGIALMKGAPHRDQAVAFLAFLCGPEGAAFLDAKGPAALRPPLASKEDLPKLPASLRPLVAAAP